MKKKLQCQNVLNKFRSFIVVALVLIGSSNGLELRANDLNHTSESAVEQLIKEKLVTLNFKNVGIRTILTEIKKQSQIGFALNNNEIESSLNSLSIQVENVSVDKALTILLRESNYRHSIVENHIMIKKKEATPAVKQQDKVATIKGKVIDDERNAVAGATVLVANSSNGAITNERGEFSLKANIGDQIEVSCLGMLPDMRVINGNTENLIITLKRDAVVVDDVIVTGIFNKSKESYTGAITSVSAKDLKVFKGQNLIATLKNIDPSLNIITNNNLGSNPNMLPEINIRGNSSLPMSIKELNEDTKSQLNTPLIIMDGFEVTLQKLMDFNDEEIENINILKDASATAIYGSRGANGVIVVTTKAPAEGKLKIFLQGGINLEMPDLSSYNLLNSSEKLELERLVGLYTSKTDPRRDIELKRMYNSRLEDVLRGVDTYWLSQPVRTGVGQKYNARFEGGSNEFRWSASAAYNNIKGAMKGSERNTFNGAITLSYKYKNVIFKNQTSIGFNKGIESNYGNFSTYAKMNPYFERTDRDGKMIETYTPISGDPIGNPLYDAQLNIKNENRYNEIINNFSIDWDIYKSLKLRAQLGLYKTTNYSDVYYPSNHSKFKTEEYKKADNLFRLGSYDYSMGEVFNYEGSLTLSYSKTFNDKHQVYFGVNYSISQSDSYGYDISAEGFSNENMNFLTNALQYKDGTKPAGTENISRLIGLVGNANYTYDNRYYLDLSYRIDGSSQFGTNDKFAPFWSGGIGWNLHQEKFMRDVKFLSRLKLRGSYGVTGSQQFTAYQALSTFSYYSDKRYMIWNGAELMGFGNENLKWQTTDQINGGIEVGLFSNRLSASFDIYNKKTYNLLSQMDLPKANGFNSYPDNVGEVRNQGYEAMLSGYLIRNIERNIVWTITGKIAYNDNKITQLSEAIKRQNELAKKEDVEINRLLYEGYSENAIFAVPSLGIDPSTGNEVFLDANNNIVKKWNPSDKRYFGVMDAKYRGNVSSMFIYKNFSLNLSFGYNWGGQQYNETLLKKVEITENKINDNVDRRVLTDRWMQVGDVKVFKGISDTETKATSRFVMDDNVFELQSANLQYKWDSNYLKDMFKIQALTVGVNMSDVFHISTIKRERGLEYPFARRVSVSLSLMF